MKTLILIFIFFVIVYFLGQLNEVLEGNPRWEKIKMAGMFIAMLPFLGFALGGWIGNKLGVEYKSPLIGVLGFVSQALYMIIYIQIIRSFIST